MSVDPAPGTATLEIPTRAARPVPRPRVFVSVLHWAGSATTIECIESIQADGYPDLDIVLVDNGSDGVACAEISRRWPAVTVIRNPVNRGFAEGQNQGIRHAMTNGAAFVLMLNDDALLLPGCIGGMVDLAMGDRRIGLLSPVIYCKDEPTRVQFQGAWVDTDRAWVMQPGDPASARAADGDRSKLSCLWGTALMIRREVVEQIGLLDERFYAYYEDLDYSLRASHGGWHNRMCFDAAVLHEDRKTTVERAPYYFYLSARNEVLWWRKHFGAIHRFRAYRVCLALFLRRTAVLRDAGLGSRVEASISGLWDGHARRSGRSREDRKAPRWFGRLLLSHPYFLADVLEGRLWSTLRQATRRRGET